MSWGLGKGYSWLFAACAATTIGNATNVVAQCHGGGGQSRSLQRSRGPQNSMLNSLGSSSQNSLTGGQSQQSTAMLSSGSQQNLLNALQQPQLQNALLAIQQQQADLESALQQRQKTIRSLQRQLRRLERSADEEVMPAWKANENATNVEDSGKVADRRLRAAIDILGDAQRFAVNGANKEATATRERAAKKLQAIIDQYQNSAAAAEAQKLLQDIYR